MPDALAGRDVLGRGQTGSGKTLAFGLPVLARVAAGGRARPRHPKALILVPDPRAGHAGQRRADAAGPGRRRLHQDRVRRRAVRPQIDALRRGVDVLVATPGRLGDLIERGACSPRRRRGHRARRGRPDGRHGLPARGHRAARPDARRTRQRLLFSATLDGDVDTLVKRFMTDPVTHSTAPPTAAVVHDGPPPAADPAARQVRRRRVDRQPCRAAPSCSPGPRSASTGWSSSSPRSASAPARCTAARPSGYARARWPSSRKAASTSWSPPTSPPAASTSTASRWSCTSTRRRTRRTTCTGPAVPRGPASPARSSRWCCRSSGAPRWR